MSEALVERIYEAAFLPETWPGLLESLADRVEASCACVIIDEPHRQPLVTSTPARRDELSDYCTGGGWQRSEMTAYARNTPPAAFLLDEDFFPKEVLRRAPAEAVIPLGVGALIGTVFPMPSGEMAAVLIQRREDARLPVREALSWLNEIRPHLGRAAMISGRLHLEQANNTVQTLSQLRLPTAVLGAGATVLASNQQFDTLKGPFRIGAFDRLSLTNGPANALFRQAVADTGSPTSTVKSIPLPARGDEPSMIVHVAPIERNAHDIFNRAACMVIVTPIGMVDVPDGAMLNGLFDLSPAEARLVQKLARGLTINQVADDLALSVATLRTQLRSVFAKTGTTRQAELGRLIGSVTALSPPT